MLKEDPFADAAPEFGDEAQVANPGGSGEQPPAEDYFAAPPPEAPEPPKKAPAKKAAPKKVEVAGAPVVQTEGKVVLTFKGGTGFDAPWIVIHAESLDDALEHVTGDNAAKLANLFTRVQNAGREFAKNGPKAENNGGGNRGGGGNRRSNAPREAQQPPADAPPAPGPDWVYRSGKKKNGNGTWQGWFPPQGSTADPVWF